jgi:cytochrome c biogenesis protein CcmG/thiol:disulfide interchange protein DsbE
MLPFIVVVVVGVAVVTLGVVFSSRFGTDPTLTASPLIGQPSPELSLPYLEIESNFDFSQLDGDVAVVNFWASWCLSCRTEHDVLLAAASDYADLGVRFVGVMVQDQPGNGSDFLDELGRGEPYVYLGVPETFFIDRDGTIVAKVSGPVDGPILAGTLDAILLGRAEDLGVVKTGEVENR